MAEGNYPEPNITKWRDYLKPYTFEQIVETYNYVETGQKTGNVATTLT